ncbi:hypothetical protein AHF37_09689 [Paragonimus kellicotti]|nr:hypothetical protein AHF37_09689 [Paragonimus kellicotti]
MESSWNGQDFLLSSIGILLNKVWRTVSSAHLTHVALNLHLVKVAV